VREREREREREEREREHLQCNHSIKLPLLLD
jgi:hypothetical protein